MVTYHHPITADPAALGRAGYRTTTAIAGEGAGTAGDLVTDTSTGITHQWDGQDWVPLPRLGAQSTAGTLDWDDATNARPGSGVTLLRDTATNAPPAAAGFWHSFCFEYATQTGAGNITQFAIPYGRQSDIDAGIWMRGRFAGAWTTWSRIDGATTATGTFTGDGATLTFDMAHNLGTPAPSVTIHSQTTGDVYGPGGPQLSRVDDNTTRATFGVAPLGTETFDWRAV